ncbi:head-tail connector protein [Jeotgalibacillus aurantiacus]|uniref:head-tail connector protein n=1 Tax=Jeotgalibacillus aurantiacus TaxID=2763266 RepID=UPI001D0B1C60|nr:head-tail connector protein [Jeotgalibacillus aurantiacus]
MPSIEQVRKDLRVSSNAFDDEIESLMAAARADLKSSGVSAEKVDATTNTDPLIDRAIRIYCKAEYGFDNPEAPRFRESYQMLKDHLCLAGDYREQSVE